MSAGTATAVAAGTSLVGGALAAGAAGDAAGVQSAAGAEAINELRGALDPSLEGLDEATRRANRILDNIRKAGVAELAPYSTAGLQATGRLNTLLGLPGQAPTAPTAPRAPKVPKYALAKSLRMGGQLGATPQAGTPRPVDIKPRRGQFKTEARYQRALENFKRYRTEYRQYQTQQRQYQAALPEYQAQQKAYEARQKAPEYGSLMKSFAEARPEAAKPFTPGEFKFEEDPGYAFRREEGLRGIEQAAAARGILGSTGTLRGLTRFGQDLASQEYGNAYQRYLSDRDRDLAEYLQNREGSYRDFATNREFLLNALTGQQGVGQAATGARSALRLGTQGQKAQNLLGQATQAGDWRFRVGEGIAGIGTDIANAQAAGQVGAANAWSQGLQGVQNALLLDPYFSGGAVRR